MNIFTTIVVAYKWIIFLGVVTFLFRIQFAQLLVAIANLCNRIKSTTFEFAGIKLGADTTLFLGSENANDQKIAPFLKAFQSPIVTNEEKIIKNQLAEAKCTDDQAITILISQLANRNVLSIFFLIDRMIYNEQIELLLYLNTNNKTCPGEEMQKFYMSWKEKNSNFTTTYQQFLGFLVGHGLLNQNSNGCSISILGKDYLSFIIKFGRQLPLEKIVPPKDNADNAN